MSDEDQRPRREDMERAAKVAISADESIQEEQDSGNDNDGVARNAGGFQARLRATIRALGITEQRPRARVREPTSGDEMVLLEEESGARDGPPSVIAIPEVDETAFSSANLDAVSQSTPLVLANLVQESRSMADEALDQRFQQITEMLLRLEEQQTLTSEAVRSVSLTGSYCHEEQLAGSSTHTRNQSLSSSDTRSGATSMDQSGRFLQDIPEAQPKEAPPRIVTYHQSPPRPDPPAMISGMIQNIASSRRCDDKVLPEDSDLESGFVMVDASDYEWKFPTHPNWNLTLFEESSEPIGCAFWF